MTNYESEDTVKDFFDFRQNAVTDWEIGFKNVLAQVMPVENCVLLDYGCGTGSFSRFAVARGLYKAIGVDTSKGMIENANKQTIKAGKDYSRACEFRQIESANLDFMPDAGIDRAVFNFILCTLREDDQIADILQATKRTLKVGGRAVLLNVHWDHANGKRFTSFACKSYPTLEHGQPVETDLFLGNGEMLTVTDYYRSLDAYTELVEDAGLRVTNILEPMADEGKRAETRVPPFHIITAEKIT